MADIKDIASLISRARFNEREDPGRAHAMYEVAERDLDRMAILLGIESGPEGPYGWAFRAIIDGYGRLTGTRPMEAVR